MSDSQKGFFENHPCKACGRYRRLRFKHRRNTDSFLLNPEYNTVVERDGLTYSAGAFCGACEKKGDIANLVRRLDDARKALVKAEAHANAMHERYKPR